MGSGLTDFKVPRDRAAVVYGNAGGFLWVETMLPTGRWPRGNGDEEPMLSRRDFVNCGLAYLSNAGWFDRIRQTDGAKPEISISCIFDVHAFDSSLFTKYMMEDKTIAVVDLQDLSCLGYKKLLEEFVQPRQTSRILAGITNYTDYTVMRSFARDHGFRIEDRDSICARLEKGANETRAAGLSRALDVLKGLEQLRVRDRSYMSWVLTDPVGSVRPRLLAGAGAHATLVPLRA